jgi:hypothetical protein
MNVCMYVWMYVCMYMYVHNRLTHSCQKWPIKRILSLSISSVSINYYYIKVLLRKRLNATNLVLSYCLPVERAVKNKYFSALKSFMEKMSVSRFSQYFRYRLNVFGLLRGKFKKCMSLYRLFSYCGFIYFVLLYALVSQNQFLKTKYLLSVRRGKFWIIKKTRKREYCCISVPQHLMLPVYMTFESRN